MAVASNTAAGDANLLANAYSDAGGYKYKLSGVATSRYQQYAGAHNWFTAASGTAGNAISFTQAMTLDASGRLLVGTTSAISGVSLLVVGGNQHLRNAAGGTTRFIMGPSTNSVEYGGLIFDDTDGSMSYGTFANYAAKFITNNTERARIDSNGNLLVGYTASNGSYLLQVNSQIYATNATIATSDGRYKESVQPLQNALSLISTLNPVSFKWKHHDVHNFAVGETDVGFIAQEVKQSLENTAYVNQVVKANTCTLTDGTEEEFLGIAEGKMIPLLVKAIQELKAEVDSLKAQLNK